MEGRTIVRPDPALRTGNRTTLAFLQWRAGQSSGQTAQVELRAAAQRILQWRAGQSSGQTTTASFCATGDRTTFNGGPDNRPARQEQRAADELEALTPSMEGRTIVRPDRCRVARSARRESSFNGGPDNRPARPVNVPNTKPTAATFNGGPDNRPARRENPDPLVIPPLKPSMEGRTIVRPDGSYRCRDLFVCVPSMEGRTIVRPDQQQPPIHETGVRPSMEGRTIVRPDPGEPVSLLVAVAPFNGGPDNRPARPVDARRCG